MDRRTFHRLCGGLIAGAGTLHRELAAAAPTGAGTDAPWPRTRLVDADDAPLTPESLAPGESLVFHYPYRVTPCFLLRLPSTAASASSTEPAADELADASAGTRAGAWPGGVGAGGSVVAFSAICSHKMSHPARPISHIAYRGEPVEFVDRDGVRQTRAGTISCCSERSVYDPADGARVLTGPAPMPLAAIELALDEDGTIAAVRSLGQDRYAAFIDAFGFRLALEHGSSDVRRMSGDSAVAIRAEDYSRQQIRC